VSKVQQVLKVSKVQQVLKVFKELLDRLLIRE
jgi:hypothetical protein